MSSSSSSSSSSSFTIRVRTQLGTWRIQDVSPTADTFGALKERIEREHSTRVVGGLMVRPSNSLEVFDEAQTPSQCGIKNGDMIYASVDETRSGIHEASSQAKFISKDGNIVAQEYSTVAANNGFRPGMMPLRSMKMQWTLNEFVAMDEQFEFKIKAQAQSTCNQVSIDTKALQSFQKYLYTFDFHRMRIGYLYGTFTPDNKVKVEYIYEPVQDTTGASFVLPDDPKIDAVEAISAMLGFRRVGWIFAHPPREERFNFSCAEVMSAAEQQLEAADGIADTPYVTMKVTLNVDTNELSVDGWQVSNQCMEMVAEGAIHVSPNLGYCAVNPTFTAYVEGRPAKEIDNDFFLTRVPIVQHSSELICTFPTANREGEVQTRDDLKAQLKKVGKEGWTLQTLLADFQLLLFLTSNEFLDLASDLPALCRSVKDPSVPVDEGYQVIIRSLAGIE